MAGQSGTPFPFTAVAIVVAFVSSVLLVPHTFDLLRPAESTKIPLPVSRDLEVDARLWEDPFTATERYERERAARCKSAAKPDAIDCQETELRRRRAIGTLVDRWRAEPAARRLLLAALVPGNPFVGAEESRRRARYALLAGLNAQDYVPDDAEHVGLLESEQAGDVAQAALRGRLAIPYERLRPLRNSTGKLMGTAYDEVVLLWVDEAGLRQPKTDGLATLLGEFHDRCGSRALERVVITGGAQKPGAALTPTRGADAKAGERRLGCPDLAIIGPSSSEGLHVAARDLLALHRESLDAITLEGYRYIARARIVNAAATASAEVLGFGETSTTAREAAATAPDTENDLAIAAFMRARLAGVVCPPTGDCPALRMTYTSTIVDDGRLLTLLIRELAVRGALAPGSRIVLLGEWDTLYAQNLARGLKEEIGAPSTRVAVEVHNYLRGIDGVTVQDDPKAVAARGGADAKAIEWPESRDQRDYLRRLAQVLVDSTPRKGPIAAIGIVGSDVHDKLLAMQALRESFPDIPFFTTDLDARYLHPRALPFTRNLVVASSLPLAFDRAELQGPTPPFRDVYQSAMYLAARLAGAGAGDTTLPRLVREELDRPRLFEIGRTELIALGPERAWGAPASDKVAGSAEGTARGVAAGLLALVVLGAFWIQPSTPSLRVARAGAPRLGLSLGEENRLVAIFVAAHCGAFTFAALNVFEMLWPGHVTFGRAMMWSLLVAAAALVCIYPGARWFVSRMPVRPIAALAGRKATGPVVVGSFLALVVVLAVVPAVPSFSIFEPLYWVQGVSGWPSQMIRVAALVATLAFMDYAWSGTISSGERLSLDLGFDDATILGTDFYKRKRDWLRGHSILHWRYPADRKVDFDRIWTDYRRRGRSRARVVRVLFWTVFTSAVISLFFYLFSEGARLFVPVRGEEHRQLMTATLGLVSLAFIGLVVATADATMLACRLLRHVTRARTVFPDHVIERFAYAMGPALAPLWRKRVDISGGLSEHTMLDDWIDIQILARRTSDVAPLVMLPFIVLALLILARSRLFDNWALTPAIAMVFGFYLLWLVTLGALLKFAADRARADALRRMRTDLRWLQGSSDDMAKLAKPMEGLIASVEGERRGAFADLFDQPLLKAILLPLGGAGGVQLIDYFLLGR